MPGDYSTELFQNIKLLLDFKYKSCTSPPKITNFGHVVDKFKRNNFTFGKEFKFPTKFQLKIQELNYV
jgi:hypothetical protein